MSPWSSGRSIAAFGTLFKLSILRSRADTRAFVGGRRIDREEPVKDSDDIRIGSVRLILRISSER